MSNLIIVRGPSGSGKTTFAKERFPDYNLIEADMYFYRDGGYNFEAVKLKDAHEWCQCNTRGGLRVGKPYVVANTFTRLWEMQPYLDMGYPTTVYRMTSQYQNVHSVPESVVQSMKDRMEDYEGEILVP